MFQSANFVDALRPPWCQKNNPCGYRTKEQFKHSTRCECVFKSPCKVQSTSTAEAETVNLGFFQHSFKIDGSHEYRSRYVEAAMKKCAFGRECLLIRSLQGKRTVWSHHDSAFATQNFAPGGHRTVASHSFNACRQNLNAFSPKLSNWIQVNFPQTYVVATKWVLAWSAQRNRKKLRTWSIFAYHALSTDSFGWHTLLQPHVFFIVQTTWHRRQSQEQTMGLFKTIWSKEV
jgi:hypothetical protein